MSIAKVGQFFSSNPSLQLRGSSFCRPLSPGQMSMEKFLDRILDQHPSFPGQSGGALASNSLQLPSNPSLLESGEKTGQQELDLFSQRATAGKSNSVARLQFSPPPNLFASKKTVTPGPANIRLADEATGGAGGNGTRAGSTQPQVTFERGIMTASKTITLKDTGEVLYYSNKLLGQGGFKKVFRAQLVSSEGKTTDVAASKPFKQPLDISQFAVDMANTSSTHLISPRYVRLTSSSTGETLIVTFSPLQTPKGTHYEGANVADALIFNKPISSSFPYSGTDRYKNHFRLTHGMITGVLEYYLNLFNQEKHKGRHGDIKPSNFLFGHKTKDVTGKPYFIIKLNDCPEDPEAAEVPATHGFILAELSRHARDLHALRVCFFKSLYAAIVKPIFEGDTGSIGLHLMDKAQVKPIFDAFKTINSIIQTQPTHTGTIEEKERDLHENLQIIANTLIAAKNNREKPIPVSHFKVISMLVNNINLLNQGIKLIREKATNYKQSQAEAIKTLQRVKRLLEKHLPNSGITGSPMKPRRPSLSNAIPNHTKRKLDLSNKRKPKAGELPPSGRSHKPTIKAKKKKK